MSNHSRTPSDRSLPRTGVRNMRRRPTVHATGLNQFELLDALNRESSNWRNIRNFPDTITCRRMLRLANFAAANPRRWTATYYWHILELDAETIAARLNVSLRTVYNDLRPIRLDEEDCPPEC